MSKCRIWQSGTYNGIQEYGDHELSDFPITPTDLIIAKNIWLETLRRFSKEKDIIANEPEPISIFFRWGQLNDNDYTEVQEYIEKTTESNEA